ncbi:MAG: hypothetical protein ACE5HH_02185 [Candidatus Hydrothermarchaeales archaeon]
MKCEMCGYEFEEEMCSACGNQSCGECRCPVCGYSAPPQSRVMTFIKELRRTKDVEQ